MMTNFDWNAFFTHGFLFQINQTQLYVGYGPFKAVKIDKKNWFKDSTASNGLLIKPKFWDFTTEENGSTIQAVKPAALCFISVADFYVEFLKNVPEQALKLPAEMNWGKANKQQFQIQFEFLQQLITQNRLRKGVPITDCKATFEIRYPVQTLLSRLLARIQNQNASGHSWAYGFWEERTGYMGYTPEILFSYQADKKEMELMALAGTWSKSDPQIDFSDAKIQFEHKVVIDDIQSKLPRNIQFEKSQTRVLELKDLYHLKTDLLIKSINKEDLLDIVSSLHPTAALGLYPRNPEIASEFSKFTLQAERSTFGAPFVFLHPVHSMGLVSIRRVDWQDQVLQVWAGCGVIKESQFEMEFAEIQAKHSAIKKNFDLKVGV